MSKIDLRKGDCLEVMDKLIEEGVKVDAIITDPPYELHNLGTKWDANKAVSTNSKLVKNISQGMKFSKNQAKELMAFSKEFSSRCETLLKEGSFMLLFSQPRLTHAMGWGIDANTSLELRDKYIWKRKGQCKAFSQMHFVKKKIKDKDLQTKYINLLQDKKTAQLTPLFEDILLFQKPISKGTLWENYCNSEVGLVNLVRGGDGLLPSTIFHYEKTREDKEIKGHPTIKPQLLMEKLIEIFTNKNQVVLDFTMGSGTTGVACKNLGRSFIGIEKDDKYFEIAKERIDGN